MQVSQKVDVSNGGPKIGKDAQRLSWLWLVLALIAALCTHGNQIIPVLAWLYPLCLLRFTRGQRPLIGFLCATLLLFIAAVVWLWLSHIPLSVSLIILLLLASLISAFPFLVDRLLARRWHSWVSTLLFPLGFTAVIYLRGLADPFGDVGSLAYTQYGNLPLLQLLSLTGTSGIVFLMAWFSSICNWMWEQRFAWRSIRRGALLYSGTLALVLISGSIRLLLPSETPTVRIASLGVPQSLLRRVTPTLTEFNTGKSTQANLVAMQSGSLILTNDLLARTQREARAGAKIVVWPECGTFVLQADEPNLLTQASAVARQTGIYLDMGVCVFDRQLLPKVLDQAILISPQGEVVWHYEKAHPVQGMEDVVQGDGKVPVVATQYGHLANVICFDEDFPTLLQQAGRDQTDILLAPSNDWKEIDPWHTQATTFRAIENGFSLIRQTNNGLSIVVDAKGRTLASADYFTTQDQTMVAFVPVRGEQTLYAHIGDTFAWLCIAGWIAFSIAALIRLCKASV